MELQKMKPGQKELSFMLMDGDTNKKNTFYLTQTLTATNRITVLNLWAEKTAVKLHHSTTGNSNALNFTFALVFPKHLLDVAKWEGVEVVDASATKWRIGKEETESECRLFFLSDKEYEVQSKPGLEVLIRNLPIAKMNSTASNVELLYRLGNEPDTVYCLQTWLDILNHTGIKDSPFTLFNDTPVLSTANGKSVELRLMNHSNNAVDLSELKLRMVFDLYEDQFKSLKALVEKATFQHSDFRLELFHRKQGVDTRMGEFTKSKAADQTLFLGIAEFESSKKNWFVQKHEQLVLKMQFNKVNPIPGESPLTLDYFGVKGYWDGQLKETIKRTAYFENAENAVVDRKLKRLEAVTVDSDTLHAIESLKTKSINTDNLIAAQNIQANKSILENNHDLIPKGTIVMWNGTTPPEGWRLCNGDNGTPNLSGKFALGFGRGYPINTNGGDNTIKLSVEQLPAHHHHIELWTSENGNHNHGIADKTTCSGTGCSSYEIIPGGKWKMGWGVKSTDGGIHKHHINGNSRDTGGGSKINIMPPYYTLAYIIKV